VAEIIVHAGMAKTGSTSIQRWLTRSREQLGEQRVQLVVATDRARQDPGDHRLLEPYTAGDPNAGRIVMAWGAYGFARSIVQQFVHDLGDLASTHDKVLVTAEAFSMFFYRLDEPFLTALDALARHHTVRVAYYVRPQHTAIEALWRQGGFRRAAPPSAAVAEAANSLHYLRTKIGVEELAPHVDFGVRPFRSDLLDGGSAVSDFARTFLGIDAGGADIQENSALPLELVNRLRLAPEGVFWNGTAEHYPRGKLRAAAAHLELPSSPATKRSRQILRAYCREMFEADNQQLIRQLGWPATEFVPAATLRGEWELSELDDLWTPKDTPDELAKLFDELTARLAAR
jgi:hypothetical protein